LKILKGSYKKREKTNLKKVRIFKDGVVTKALQNLSD
jgi:hypothetical protein